MWKLWCIIITTILFLLAVIHFAHADQFSTLEDNLQPSISPIAFVIAQNAPPVTSYAVNPWIAYLYATYPLEAPVLDCLASHESHWKMEWNYMNPTGDPNSKYSAYGFFQETAGTAQEVGSASLRFDPKDNIDYAVKILNQLGINRWNVASLCLQAGTHVADNP